MITFTKKKLINYVKIRDHFNIYVGLVSGKEDIKWRRKN